MLENSLQAYHVGFTESTLDFGLLFVWQTGWFQVAAKLKWFLQFNEGIIVSGPMFCLVVQGMRVNIFDFLDPIAVVNLRLNAKIAD